MKTTSLNDFFSSTDLNLIAFLLSQGYKLDSIEKEEKGTKFHVIRDKNLDQIIQLYFSNQALANPILFAHYQKTLKSQIHHT